MKLLFIGDIVGEPGRKKIIQNLAEIVENEEIFFIIAQGEHIAGGIGITQKTAKELFDAGVDCITTGNHVWKFKEVYNFLDTEPRLLRPANYPEGVPGKGYALYEKSGVKISVINLEGRIFMKPLDDPLKIGKIIAEKVAKETKNIFIDFHAEATGEKRVLALYLSEYATAIIGTHTHVQTADEQIINNKTACITDVGMVGSINSVIGIEQDEIIKKFMLQIPQKFEVAKENIIANCVIIDFDKNSGTAKSIIRYNF